MRILVSHETDDQVGAELISGVSGAEVVPYDPNAESLTPKQRDAEVLIPPYRSSHRPIPLLEQLPRLRMVQLLSAGADEWASDVPASVTLASARGAHAGPVSEWALSAILALYRQWPDLVRFQDARIWAHRRVPFDTLAGKEVLILGAGSIGNAIANKLQAFDANTTLVGRQSRRDVRGVDELSTLLPEHDIVVIAAPLTEHTRGLIDSKFLAAMPTGAVLVNAGRGKIVDTDALVAELQKERLRAALDVTDPEPLPEQHPLWHCPGVIISPHSARTVPSTNKLCYTVASQQIAAFARGETPSNAVDRSLL